MALGLVPLAWVAWHRPRRASWWWMAVAFAVSFAADLATLYWPHRYVSQVYPVLQAGLFVAILLPRKYAEWVIAVVLVAASVSIVGRDAAGLDVLLRMVAFGSVAGASYWLPAGPLRTALLVYFAGGALAWLGYVLAPGWTTYAGLQAARVVGIGCWCYAARRA